MIRTLSPGTLPKVERRTATPRHLLALTGGGFRGLFTARVLEQMEAEASDNIARRFDLIAGTSIGGILATGLACGISATELVARFRQYGRVIFREKFGSLKGNLTSRYDSRALRGAIKCILGDANSARPFAEIPSALCVVSIEDGKSEPKLFRTKLCGVETDATSTLDVAMATSAAPTYFDPHRLGDRTYVDGGLVANAPDLVVVCEALRLWGCHLSDLNLCSIGTAGSARIGRTEGSPGKVAWTMRHGIFDLIFNAQEALATEQAARLGLAYFLRIDKQPTRPISLDDVADRTAKELLTLAEQAVAKVKTEDLPRWRQFLAHTPVV